MRIGEFAGQAGVDPRTVRYYESIGVLPKPQRSANGYRAYAADDVRRLRFVRHARSLGLRLTEIREIVDVLDGGICPCGSVHNITARRIEELDQRIEDLTKLRSDLARLLEQTKEMTAIDDTEAICPAIESMAILP